MKDLGNMYDPCFLLPLFSAILRPGEYYYFFLCLNIPNQIMLCGHFWISSVFVLECVIDCLKFVSSHAMGVTVMALSSFDPKVRAAAYHVLSCFYQHLEGSKFREKSQVNAGKLASVFKGFMQRNTKGFVHLKQLLYLMDMMKNGIRHPNQRLPFVLTTYVTKVAQQMLKPGT